MSSDLDELSQHFMAALRAKEAGKVDIAEDTLRDILRSEPRLAEPRMELARLLLDSARLEDAETHAKEALEQLEAGNQWLDDLTPEVVLAVCHGLLAEILRRRADEDDVIFGDPDTFKDLVNEARIHFAKAAALDPSDETSSYYATFMGPPEGASS